MPFYIADPAGFSFELREGRWESGRFQRVKALFWQPQAINQFVHQLYLELPRA